MPYVENDVDEMSDVQLINEIEARGFRVVDEDDIVVPFESTIAIEKLYLDYMLTSPTFFEKQLKLFFNGYLNKTLR
jgi:hypothetical protein